MIFNVKRCGRNRWPGELKSPFSDLCWRIFNVKRCDKVFPCWSFSGRAPPCRQGSADIAVKMTFTKCQEGKESESSPDESSQALWKAKHIKRYQGSCFMTCRSFQISGHCSEEAAAHVEELQCVGPVCPRMVLQVPALISVDCKTKSLPLKSDDMIW